MNFVILIGENMTTYRNTNPDYIHLNPSERTEVFQNLYNTIAPLEHVYYASRRPYPCSATLIDGSFLPCVLVFPKISGGDEPQRTNFGNTLRPSQIAELIPSKYSLPNELRARIQGETKMGWTMWVYEMTDGKLFHYGTSFSTEFFDLPDGYRFSDVDMIHDHSYLNMAGELKSGRNGTPTNDFTLKNCYRERVFFECNEGAF